MPILVTLSVLWPDNLVGHGDVVMPCGPTERSKFADLNFLGNSIGFGTIGRHLNRVVKKCFFKRSLSQILLFWSISLVSGIQTGATGW